LGWGLVYQRICHVHSNNWSLPTIFFCGFAVFLFLTQFVNLILPLRAILAIILVVLGWLILLFDRKRLKATSEIKTSLLNGTFYVFLALLLGWGFWITIRGLAAPQNYDSGLYHLNTIRWLNEFRLLPGIGNIHDRLAFNNSFFTYVAAINFYPYFNQARTIANNLLFIMLIAWVVWESIRFIEEGGFSRPFSTLTNGLIPFVLLIPPLLHLSVTSDGFASPTPDLTSTIFQMLIYIQLVSLLLLGDSEQEKASQNIMVLMLLCVTAITLKLSNLVFAGTAILIGLSYGYKLRIKIKVMLGALFLCAGVLLVWIVRGYIASGTPLFPALIGYIPFKWAIPKQEIRIASQWIRSWGRLPGHPWQEVLSSWDWLIPWLNQRLRDLTSFVYPIVISLAFFTVDLALIWRKKGTIPTPRKLGIATLPIFTGLIFWFISAPDMRFAVGLFYLLPIVLALPLYVWLENRVNRKWKLLLLLFFFGILSVNYLGYSIL
jgi:hypothetical protein